MWWFSFSSLAAMGRRRPSAYRNDCVARRLFPPIYEHPGATVYSSRPHLYISYIHLFSFSSFCFFFLTFEKGKEDFFYCWFYFLKKTKGRSELDLCTQASKCCCNTPVAETRPSPKQNGQQRNSSRDDAIREREVPGASHPDTNRLMIGHKTVKTLATTTIHCGQSHALFISSALLPCIPKRGPLCVYKRAGYRRSYPVTNRTTASFLSFLPRFMATSINGNFGRPFFFPSSKFYLFFLATVADENLPVDNTWTLV